MKNSILIFILFLGVTLPSFAWSNFNSQYVSGYTKSNGTYVSPHYQSVSNSTKVDNWSTQGNYNPYTGSQGSVNVQTPQQNYGFNNGRSSGFGYRY